MANPKVSNENDEKNIVSINRLFPEDVDLKNPNPYLKDSHISLETRFKQQRLNLYHLSVHALAFIVVVPYVIMVGFGAEIPLSYSTIVSIVIGFYFAKSLFKNSE